MDDNHAEGDQGARQIIRISVDAKDYISGNEVHAVKWNRGEIGNGVLKRCSYTAHNAP